jgi:hypothetical protein
VLLAAVLSEFNRVYDSFFCTAVDFDFSGNYLAIGGADIRYVLAMSNYH